MAEIYMRMLPTWCQYIEWPVCDSQHHCLDLVESSETWAAQFLPQLFLTATLPGYLNSVQFAH